MQVIVFPAAPNAATRTQVVAIATGGSAAGGTAAGGRPGGAGVLGPDVLALTPPALGPAVQVRWIWDGTAFDREAILSHWQPVAGATPTVFFNLRETLLAGDAGREFRVVGSSARGLSPAAGRFAVISAHANGSAESALETGLRFGNAGKEPIVLLVGGVDVPKGTRALEADGRGTRTIVVPPGESVDLAVAQAAVHPRNGNLRDGIRPVIFSLQVQVTSGDPAALAVQDLARFPAAAAGAAAGTGAAPAGTQAVPLHHEGVFFPQRQVTVPVVLGPENAAYVRIRGSNAQHDAHYYVDHQAFVALPAGRPPRAIVFAGPGGITRPEVGGHKLPTIGNVLDRSSPEVERGGDRFRNLARHQEFGLPFNEAVRNGYLTATGTRDAQGNPVYRIDVRFVAGDNGDLLVFGTW